MHLDPSDKKQIRLWLNKFDHSYGWFAETLNVAVQTVYNWMSSDRPIPGRYHLTIQQLMRHDYERAEAKQNLVLDFTPHEYDLIEKCAHKDHQPIRKWAADQLNQIATQKLEDIEKALQPDQPGSYRFCHNSVLK